MANFKVLTWRKSQSKTGQVYSTALSKIAQHFKFVMEKGFMENETLTSYNGRGRSAAWV